MAKPSEGRSIEFLSSTEDQRKAIARVISALRATTTMSFDEMYVAAHGSLVGRAEEDERNLPKGKLAHRKMAHFYRWIVENYLPLGCEIAPEVFDPSLLTRWRDFIRAHGIYDRLTYRFAGNLGLTQRSSIAPIADQPIPLGKPYFFDIECGISGQLLALEVAKGKTYPVALHPDQHTVVMDVEKGSQTRPLKADGTPDPLAETEDKGLRCYVFVIAPKETMQSIAKGLHEAHAIPLDKLDQIALAFKDADPSAFEVHRLNVVFSG